MTKMIGLAPASLKRRWTFSVGIGQVRLCTVIASSYEEARSLAIQHEDDLAIKEDREAPVAWDLFVDRVQRLEDEPS